jgi:hypothetical protein
MKAGRRVGDSTESQGLPPRLEVNHLTLDSVAERRESSERQRAHWTIAYSAIAFAVATVCTGAVVATAGAQMPDLLYLLLGTLWVALYLLCLPLLLASAHRGSSQRFEVSVLVLAVVLRIGAVGAAYWAFQSATGTPFEFHASDSVWYHRGGETVAANLAHAQTGLYDGVRAAPSDLGYVTLLGFVYSVVGSDVLIVRVLQAVLSAWTVVVLYRAARLALDDATARTIGLLAVLNPYLVYYAGLHLKETVLIFLMVEVFYRTIRLSTRKESGTIDIALLVFFVTCMFFFRTFLAVLLLVAIGLHFVRRHGGWSRQRQIAVAVAVMTTIATLVVIVRPQIGQEVVYRLLAGSDQWERELAQKERGLGQSISSIIASRPLFVGLATVGPLPGVVAIDGQENGLIQYGFAWSRHFLLFFTGLGLWRALKRGHSTLTVITVTVIGYALILGAAGLPSSHRFQLPTLPAWSVFAGIGLHVNRPAHKVFAQWLGILLMTAAAVFLWNYLKVAVRGY